MRSRLAWLLLIAALGPAFPGQAPPGPLIRYTFDSQADPTSNLGSLGSAMDGDINPDPNGSSFVSSPGGSALVFNGSTKVVPVSGSSAQSALNIGAGDFSIYLRVRTATSSVSGEQMLVCKADSGGDRGYDLALVSGGLVRFRVGGSTTYTVTSSSGVADAAWHEILAVHSGPELRLYRDGSPSGSVPVPASLSGVATSREFTVGRRAQGGGGGFVGQIDDVRLYAAALTPAMLSGPATNDCNQNGLDDLAEIASEHTPDANGNGRPDDCDPWTSLPYGIDRVLAFGDSLTDPGNAHAAVNYPPSPPYWQGRFSNGKVWIEFLTPFLGLSSNQVVNYAYGGATTGTANVSSQIPGGIGLAQEIGIYAQAAVLGQAPVPTPSTLAVLWIGANDFEAALAQTTPPDPGLLVGTAMANIENAVRILAGLGARRFLVPDLPDLGSIPKVRARGPAIMTAARAASLGFNSNLRARLADLEAELAIDVVLFDVFTLVDQIAADPQASGFANTTGACLHPTTGTVAGNPDTYLFWDDVHPTAAAHRRLGLGAQSALLGGGAPLPPAAGSGSGLQGRITVVSPPHGHFTTASSVLVQGEAKLPRTATEKLRLDANGLEAHLDAGGPFSVTVPLPEGRIEHPIVLTLRAGDEILDQERLVVFRSSSLNLSTTVDDAVVGRLTPEGMAEIADEINGRLLSNFVLDLRTPVLQSNPLDSNFQGEFHYVVDATNAGFSTSSIEIVPMSGRVRVRLNIHDFFIDVHFHGWLPNYPDPGFNCDGRMANGLLSVYADFSFSPGPAGAVNVTQLTPLEVESLGFFSFGDCSGLAEFLVEARFRTSLACEDRLENAIRSRLEPLNQSRVLETELEEILARVAISGPVGGALGVNVSGGIGAIVISPEAAQVRLDTRLSGPAPAGTATAALPTQALPSTGLDPVTGQPYEFAVSVALKTINQLLLAKGDVIPSEIVLDSLDFGTGPHPITAGLLGAFIPRLASLGAATPVQVRLRRTLPPMLVGPGGSAGSLADLYVGQLEIACIPLSGPYDDRTVLALGLDLGGSVGLSFQSSALVVSLDLEPDFETAAVLVDELGVDQDSLMLVLRSLTDSLLQAFGPATASFPIPAFEGIQISAIRFVAESGYVTAYLDLDTSYARPDLIVESLDIPSAIDVNFGFSASVRVRNVGSRTAYGGTGIGLSLSLDQVMGNDAPLGITPVGFGNGLAPGESATYSLWVNPMPWAVQTEQTLFALADVPQYFGGAGFIFEQNERNNHLGAQILTTTPDAFVVSVTVPDNVIGGIGPRPYRVRVGRNNVGINTMTVPIAVTIGQPVLTFVNPFFVDVPRGGYTDVDVYVLTPASYGSAGQSNTFTVKASANLMFDSNRGNDTFTTSVSIAVPWWDVRLSIVNASTTARRCQGTNWRVQVLNAGNVPTPNVCCITGIGLNSGAGNWGSNLGIFNFTTPNIAPGATWTYDVAGSGLYWINCGAFLTTQYIKAEIHYSAGCFDLYTAGNYAQRSISITN